MDRSVLNRTDDEHDFNDPNADVVFLSSDGVQFHIHKVNLQVSAGQFAPDLIGSPSDNGVVTLTENAVTLKLLFAFLYPQRHPKLNTRNFQALELVAEAAEKYEVYAAMDICLVQMGTHKKYFPIEVLNYAFKHGYTDLLNETAVFTIDKPFDEIADKMATNLLAPWVRQSVGHAQTDVEQYGRHPCRRVTLSEAPSGCVLP